MVISISSQKGGTGKTSSTIALAAGLAKKDKRVLIIDVDSQANSSKVLLGADYIKLKENDTIYRTIMNREELPIHESYLENLHIVPSHILLADTDIKLSTAFDHREARLKTQLDKVATNYDYIFVDCPPTLSWLTINALVASNKAIVVVSPGYFELDSTVQIRKVINDIKTNFNPELEIWGFLFTMADSTIASRSSLSLLRQTYPNSVFNTVISKNTDVREAHLNKQDIFTYNPDAKAAQDYLRLINELFLTA